MFRVENTIYLKLHIFSPLEKYSERAGSTTATISLTISSGPLALY